MSTWMGGRGSGWNFLCDLYGLGFPIIRDAILGFSIIRTKLVWSLYWGSPFFWKATIYVLECLPQKGPREVSCL